MSSHWRSSHSQFLPWMRVSPGGWQVHCPHRHWPEKKETKSKKDVVFWQAECSKLRLIPKRIPPGNSAGSHMGGGRSWGGLIWEVNGSLTGGDAGVGQRTRVHLQRLRTCVSQPPPPRGRASLYRWSSLEKHNVRWPLNPKVKCIPAHWSVHQAAGGGVNSPRLWDEYLFLLLFPLTVNSYLVFRYWLMVTHGNQVAPE